MAAIPSMRKPRGFFSSTVPKSIQRPLLWSLGCAIISLIQASTFEMAELGYTTTFDANHILLTPSQPIKAWIVVSSFSKHHGHIGPICIPLLIRFCLTRRMLWHALHTRFWHFGAISVFQISGPKFLAIELVDPSSFLHLFHLTLATGFDIVPPIHRMSPFSLSSFPVSVKGIPWISSFTCDRKSILISSPFHCPTSWLMRSATSKGFTCCDLCGTWYKDTSPLWSHLSS